MDIAYAKKKAEAFRKRAETAEENYQVSGEQKYRRAQIEYELIADAIDAQIRNDDTNGQDFCSYGERREE